MVNTRQPFWSDTQSLGMASPRPGEGKIVGGVVHRPRVADERADAEKQKGKKQRHGGRGHPHTLHTFPTSEQFPSIDYASPDIWVSTYRRPALSAGAEAAEYTWTPDATLDIGEEMVSTSVEDGTERSVPADDYALTITDASGAQVTGAIHDVGTYTVKVTMESDSYVLAEGKDTFTATVRPLDLSRDDVALILPDGRAPMPVYTGESVYPQLGDNMIEVEVGGVGRGALPADCFTIEAAEGRNDVNAGDAYLTVVERGNATGEAELAYTIIAKSIADQSVTVEPIGKLVYTGSALEPSVTVKDGDTVLVEGEDYEVTFEENTDAGTVTVTITGTGNYSGETEVTFEIVKATAPAIQWPEVTGGLTYGQKVAEIPLSAMEDDNGAFVWKCRTACRAWENSSSRWSICPTTRTTTTIPACRWNARCASRSRRRTSPRSPWTPSPRRRRPAAPLHRP